MTPGRNSSLKHYYFIDIDLYSRQIVSWGAETKDQVDFKLSNVLDRAFLSKGQYNKLIDQLKKAKA